MSGTPITIWVSVGAELATSAAEVRVFLPEVELAKLGGWEREVPAPDGPLPLQAAWRTSLARGATFRRSTSLTIPIPGYYRVEVSVAAGPGEARRWNGRTVLNETRAEAWLLVMEDGGRVTDHFDPALVPPGTSGAPGAFFRRPPG